MDVITEKFLKQRIEREESGVHATEEDYFDGDSFSLVDASFLWFDLKPDEVAFHKGEVKKVIAIAKVIFNEIDPEEARYKATSWRSHLYSSADLVILANKRGEKPPFLFPEVRCDFDSWLNLNKYQPIEAQELTDSGYKTIAVAIGFIGKLNKCSNTQAIDLIAEEAEYLKTKNQDLNIRGIKTSTLATLAKKGTELLDR